MRRVIVGIVIVAILAAGGYFVYRQFLAPAPEETETEVDVNTQSVDTGVDVVSAEGEVRPLRDVELAFELGGEVAEILVAEGEGVTAGQPLIRLDTTDLDLALQQAVAGLIQTDANLEAARAGLASAQTAIRLAEIGVDNAEVQLALVKAEPRPEQIAVSETNVASAEAGIVAAAGNRDVTLEGATDAQIRAAEAQVVAAQAALKPLQDAYGLADDEEDREDLALDLHAANLNLVAAETALGELSAGATASERQAAQAAVAAAAAQRDAALAQLSLLLVGAKPEQVTVSEVTVEQAQAAVSEAELGVLQAEAAVKQAEAGAVQAQAAVDTAQQTLAKATLTAPFDGIVARIDVELGEVVTPGIPVITLADFSGWIVQTTDLTELDVVSVAVGFPAEVRLDSVPNEVLLGTVTDISAVSALVRGDVTYDVTVSLDDTRGLPLRWGMTADVAVDVEQD